MANEIILDVDPFLTESRFNQIPLVNENSRDAVQQIMVQYDLESYNKMRLCIGSLQYPVESPDKTYIVTGKPFLDKCLYKNENIKVTCFESNLVYPVAFSPDSKFFAHPIIVYNQLEDSDKRPLDTYAIQISSTETGRKVTSIDNIRIPTNDYLNKEYTNNLVQVFWSADGKSIILNYIHDEWGPEKPDTTLHFIKCDLDYDKLLQASPLSGKNNENSNVEKNYVGPSSIEIKKPISSSTTIPSIVVDEEIPSESPSFFEQFINKIRILLGL